MLSSLRPPNPAGARSPQLAFVGRADGRARIQTPSPAERGRGDSPPESTVVPRGGGPAVFRLVAGGTVARGSPPPSGAAQPGGLHRLPDAASYSSYRFRSVPIPSMVTSTVLPGFIEPTPTDVPQQMMSPGCSVMSCEIALTMRSGGKKRSVTG